MAKTKVLFVCLGNICRSPMAEAIFVHLVKENNISNEFEIDSAGTSGFHIGESPDSRSIKCCKQNGVSVNHTCRQVSKEDFTYFNHILCMDESNLRDLISMRPQNSIAEVKLLGDYDPNGERIIEDPYYGGNEGFQHNFIQCRRSCISFLQKLGYKINE